MRQRGRAWLAAAAVACAVVGPGAPAWAAPAEPAAVVDQAAALLDAARAGDRGALARLLTLVERGGEEARSVGRVTHPAGGGAYTVGITGAPGAGKSTLTNRLVAVLREAASLGLPVETLGRGVAREQSPPPGTVLAPGMRVQVRFGL